MALRILLTIFTSLWATHSVAVNCTGLPEWKRQHYYLQGDQVQYQGTAYENTAASSKRDRPDNGDPWTWQSATATCRS